MLALVLVGCAGDGRRPPDVASDPSSAQTPPTDACYQITYDDYADREVAPAAAPVDCEGPHTSTTFAVEEDDRVGAGARDELLTECIVRLSSRMGIGREQLSLYALRPALFTPSQDAVEAGARWYRCDVVIVASTASRALGPRPAAVALTNLGRVYPPEPAYAACRNLPEGDRSEPDEVSCDRPHELRSYLVQSISDRPSERWPGRARADARTRTMCERNIALVPGYERGVSYRATWQYPSERQWRDGFRFSTCFAGPLSES